MPEITKVIGSHVLKRSFDLQTIEFEVENPWPKKKEPKFWIHYAYRLIKETKHIKVFDTGHKRPEMEETTKNITIGITTKEFLGDFLSGKCDDIVGCSTGESLVPNKITRLIEKKWMED